MNDYTFTYYDKNAKERCVFVCAGSLSEAEDKADALLRVLWGEGNFSLLSVTKEYTNGRR